MLHSTSCQVPSEIYIASRKSVELSYIIYVGGDKPPTTPSKANAANARNSDCDGDTEIGDELDTDHDKLSPRSTDTRDPNVETPPLVTLTRRPLLLASAPGAPQSVGGLEGPKNPRGRPSKSNVFVSSKPAPKSALGLRRGTSFGNDESDVCQTMDLSA